MFAQPPPTTKPPQAVLQNVDFYVALAILAGALLIAAVAIHFLNRWQKRQTEDVGPGRETTLDLTSYRELYENGEITQSEYERIRDKLAVKMRQEVGLAGPAAAPPQPAPPPQSPNPEESPPADGSPPAPAAG